MRNRINTCGTQHSMMLFYIFGVAVGLVISNSLTVLAARPWSASPLYKSSGPSSAAVKPHPKVSRVKPAHPINKPGGCMPARPHTCTNTGITKKKYRRSVSVYGPVHYGTYYPGPVESNRQTSVTNIYINTNQSQSRQQPAAPKIQPPIRPAPRSPVCPGTAITSIDPVSGAVSISYTSSPQKCR